MSGKTLCVHLSQPILQFDTLLPITELLMVARVYIVYSRQQWSTVMVCPYNVVYFSKMNIWLINLLTMQLGFIATVQLLLLWDIKSTRRCWQLSINKNQACIGSQNGTILHCRFIFTIPQFCIKYDIVMYGSHLVL